MSETKTIKATETRTKVTSTKTNLPKKVFSLKINTQAIFDTIMSERASVRQGTHKTKDRSEVRGGGRKPWRQKGTGRARAGTTRGPIWVGGGRVFGPTPERNYNLKVNKKVRKVALFSALSLKASENAIKVNEIKLDKISTKELISKVSKLLGKNQKKALIVTSDEKVFKSARNVKTLDTTKLSSISVEQIINADIVILSNKDIKTLEGMVK